MRTYIIEVTKFILLLSSNLTVLSIVSFATIENPSVKALIVGSVICFFSILSIYMLARAVCDKLATQRIISFTFFILLKAFLIITLFKGLRGKPDVFLWQSCIPFISLIPIVFSLVYLEKNKDKKS